MNYYCDHNICPMQTSLPLATDTVMVNSMLHLQQVSDVLGIDIEQLRALNPQYKRDIIPGNTEPSVLKLPASQTYAFVDKEDSVYTHRIEELLGGCVPVNAAGGSKNLTLEKITHVVASIPSRIAMALLRRISVNGTGSVLTVLPRAAAYVCMSITEVSHSLPPRQRRPKRLGLFPFALQVKV